MILQCRRRYPRVKKYGLYYVGRELKNDPLLREIQEAVKGMSIERQVSSGAVTIVDGQTAKKDPLTGSFQQHPQSSI